MYIYFFETPILVHFQKRMSGGPVEYEKIDYRFPTPNSLQQRLFTYDEVREFNMPSYKRTYISEKYDLIENGHGYVDWVVEHVKKIGKFVSYRQISFLQNDVTSTLYMTMSLKLSCPMLTLHLPPHSSTKHGQTNFSFWFKMILCGLLLKPTG